MSGLVPDFFIQTNRSTDRLPDQWRTQNFLVGFSVTSHRDDVSFSDVTAIIMP